MICWALAMSLPVRGMAALVLSRKHPCSPTRSHNANHTEDMEQMKTEAIAALVADCTAAYGASDHLRSHSLLMGWCACGGGDTMRPASAQLCSSSQWPLTHAFFAWSLLFHPAGLALLTTGRSCPALRPSIKARRVRSSTCRWVRGSHQAARRGVTPLVAR